MYELIAFDMDGTLLNSKKQILPSSMIAIQEAIDAGKTVALSTGRCLPELKIFGNQLDCIPYFVCVSGALVYDNRQKNAVWESVLDAGLIAEVMKKVEKFDVLMHFLSWDSYMQSDKLDRLEDFQMGIYRPMYEINITRVEDIYSFFRETGKNLPIFKLNLYCKTPEQREEIRSLIQDLPLELCDAEITSLECSPIGVSKAEGLRRLCAHLGIPIENTIAVGDADNDLAILEAAGLSVAMGNANDKVKELSDVVVSSCDEDGCAEAIHRYLLEIPG